VEDFAVPGDLSTQEIFSLLRDVTYEAKQTLDLLRPAAAKACPWLSTALVAGSVRRGRGVVYTGIGIVSDVVKVEGEDLATPGYYLRSVDTRKPRDRNNSPIWFNKTKQYRDTP